MQMEQSSEITFYNYEETKQVTFPKSKSLQEIRK